MGVSAGESGRDSWCNATGVSARLVSLSLISMLSVTPLDSGSLVSSVRTESSIPPGAVSPGGSGNWVVLTVSDN